MYKVRNKWSRASRLGFVLAILGGMLGLLQRTSSQELFITSDPPGAVVSFEGQVLGETPCRVKVRARGRLRLERSGYIDNVEYLRLDNATGQKLHLKLRPGVISPGNHPCISFYPPSRGRPPETYSRAPSGDLAGHPYAIPHGWKNEPQPSNSSQLRLSSGDGLLQPLRQATLIISDSSLEERWEQRYLEKQRDGWIVVAYQRGPYSSWIRLERANGLNLSRSMVVLQKEKLGVAELDYRYEDCHDVFLYTRDLDYLRSCLGFQW